ncbi:hypothetical protein QCN29_36365 [Streptomyces sp. HNM0663]|uniref:Uncharacterized protein n=1 Tax=Streptomyces chengmaiensis TaxID=3040919 RepID=A0ABT6I172_9ACTN|nr:hypothetical protein [Streptomyces chengmaiensis]MDH2394114.1 hypothetical protein [Streptomyces chengmaiensis]
MSGLELWKPIAYAIDSAIPKDHKRPIAIVGAGSIVEAAHLPAYRLAGLADPPCAAGSAVSGHSRGVGINPPRSSDRLC